MSVGDLADEAPERTEMEWGVPQARALEQAFEGWDYDFYDTFTIPHERLAAICGNIIANGGIFKP